MSNSFYIPIQSMNLAHYLGSGIIAPSIYIKNKNTDIQDRFKNHLLLSSSKFTEETNCAIEIVLNKNEEALKKLSKHFYLFDMPLPISRVKNIYFTNEKQKINTNFNITTGSAFIPEGLLKVSQEDSIETEELDNIEFESSEKNWSEYLKKYDQVLGGFSTMKISKENFQNYPTHYFSSLGNINNLFSNILTQQNIEIENSFQFAFTDEGRFKNFNKTIYSDIDYNEVQRYAENDNVNLEVKNGLIQIDKIPENTQTYLIAILESYGKGKRKQVDSFISDLLSGKFNAKRKEGLSLIFGLNKGYKAFRNKYKTTNFEIDIKFHLDSKLDYYIIESIYQNIFNSLSNISSYKYIDLLFLEVKKEVNKNTDYITYQMIDETIIWKPRILSPVEKLLTKIAEIASQWFPNFVLVKKNDIELLFKKEIEQFKTEVENDLKTNHLIEIEQLTSSNSEKDNSINQLNIEVEKLKVKNNQLNEQITKNIQSKVKFVEKQDENENQSNPKTNMVSENTGSLFSDYTSSRSVTSRELELKKKTLNDLRPIAKKYGIQKAYSLKKDELIAEIVKYESK